MTVIGCLAQVLVGASPLPPSGHGVPAQLGCLAGGVDGSGEGGAEGRLGSSGGDVDRKMGIFRYPPVGHLYS